MARQDDLIVSGEVKTSSKTPSPKKELRDTSASGSFVDNVQDFSLLPTDLPVPPPPKGERFRAKTEAPDHTQPPTPDFTLGHPETPSSKKPVLDIKEIGLAFRGQLSDLPQPKKLSIETFIVAMLVLCLPVLYIAIVGGVAYATLLYAISEFEYTFYSMSLPQASTYIGSVFLGLTAVLFLMKPIFARPIEGARTMTLDPRREPYITEFVRQIAQSVGAPEPASIQVDCDVRVATGFHSSIVSMIQNKLVLRIGMPIVTGCNLRQLAALITHGLVHFDRGTRMRIHYLVRDINAWFDRAATRRDAIDITLDDWALHSTTMRVLNTVSRGGSSLVRHLLTLFRLTGRFISGNVLRETEAMADQYAALISGTETYTDTITRFKELQFAYERATKQISSLHQKHQLVDDFPRFVIHIFNNLTPDERQSIQINTAQQRPTPFDTDLTVRERIVHVQAHPVSGILSWDKPAAVLLRDFDTLNKHVSLRFYQSTLGFSVEPRTLLPLSRVVTQLEETEDEAQARNRYLPLPLSTLDFPLYLHRIDESDFSLLIDELYNKLSAPSRHDDAVAMANSNAQLSKRRDGLLAAGTLLRSGVTLDAYRFELPDNAVATVDKHLVTVEKDLSVSKNHFGTWVQDMSRRLSIALTLVEDLSVCDHLDRDLAIGNRNHLLDVYRRMVKLVPTLRLLRSNHTQLDALITAPAATHRDMLFQPTLKILVGETVNLIDQILIQLQAIPFPLEHRKPDITIRDVITERFPRKSKLTDPTTIAAAEAAIIVNHTTVLMNRILGRLAIMAQVVETNVQRRQQQRVSNE